MTREEMDAEMQRLSAVTDKPWDAAERESRRIYCEELYRNFQRLSSYDWHSVVTHLIDHHATRRLPTVVQIREALVALRDRGQVGSAPEPAKCHSCQGIGFVYGWYTREGAEGKIEAVRPCPMCRQATHWPLKPDLKEAPFSDTMVQDVALMDSAAARFVIEEAERLGIGFPQAVIAALVEKTMALEDSTPSADETEDITF